MISHPTQALYRPLRSAIIALMVMTPSAALASVKVVTTTSDLAALVAEVGGAHVRVHAMSSPDQDPHYVDPKPSLVLALARADLLVFNGLELEIGWLPPLLVNSRNAAIQEGGEGFFNASVHIDPLEVPAEVSRAMGDIHPGGNPHYLHDPRRAAPVALAIGAKLAALDVKNQAAYIERARQVAGQLEAIATAQTKRFGQLSPEQRKVVTYHRSLVYILDWLGLTRPLNVEPRPGIAPSPAHVARVLRTMRTQKVRTILQERYYPTRTSDTLARLARAQVVVIPGGAHFTNHNETYTARIKRTAEVIYDALNR